MPKIFRMFNDVRVNERDAEFALYSPTPTSQTEGNWLEGVARGDC